MTELLSIILAAGEGTRMRSATPKVLHPVGGMPIIGHVARAAREAGSTQIALVTGPKHDAIRKAVTALHPDVVHFEQTVEKTNEEKMRDVALLLIQARILPEVESPAETCESDPN